MTTETQKKETDKELEKDTKKTINKVVDSLLGWVEGKKASAADPTVPKTSLSKPWGWIVGLIIAVIVFIGLALLAWYLWSKGRELAKLKHERDLNIEKKKQLEVDAQIETEEAKVKEVQKELEELDKKIKTSENKILEIEAARKCAKERINEISSWDDLEKYMGEPK